jgi:triosephosphate isomerase (TIM)
VFGETDEATGRKSALTLDTHLMPMLCVGETLAEREAGVTEAVVRGSSRPDWRAGRMPRSRRWCWRTSRCGPSARDARPRRRTPRPFTGAAVGADGRVGEQAEQVPICYGGSVNRGNVPELLAAPDVDGVLVGGASLDADGWSAIVRTEVVR